jgi:Wings apart-like protein regulation of heterochromatin
MSITELRSKGESRRFLDEVGYLFEGLEVPGMAASVQRSRYG